MLSETGSESWDTGSSPLFELVSSLPTEEHTRRRFFFHYDSVNYRPFIASCNPRYRHARRWNLVVALFWIGAGNHQPIPTLVFFRSNA
jgi:hypothetical protein